MRDDQIRERIFDSLERIEAKLDNHIQRIVASEEKIKANQGTIKVMLSGIVAIITSVVSMAFKMFFGGK